MPFTAGAKNFMLGTLVGVTVSPPVVATDLSLHTANPGLTGANEVTGGGYVRLAVSDVDWDIAQGAGNDETYLNNDKQFAGPSLEDAPYFGLWADGVFVGGGANTGDQAFNAAGEFVLKAGTRLHLNN